jgi:peptidyl-prolyl cis-trans isomerase SurA
MNKNIVLSLVATISFASVAAQKNDPVVMKINGNPITKSEFEYIYHKNNNTVSDKKTLGDYLTLFVNYKLKVEEAKSQKLDTAASFRKEFAGYQAQLAEPYLQDSLPEQQLAQKCYDRLGENLEVSHILIPFTKKQLLPADTIEVYNKAIDVWKKVTDVSNPLPFEKAAMEFSSDHSGKRPGYLGWVTANMLVPPFENAMFALPVGGISRPVRTAFGYHIIELHNRRPDVGQYKIAHIMFGTNQGMSPEQVDSIRGLVLKVHKKILAGEDYASLAKEYSSDKYSSEHGGEVGWVSASSRYPSEWMDASFALQNINDVSEPIRTSFGFHILKLLDKKDREPYAQIKPQLLNFVKNGEYKADLEKLQAANLEKEFKAERFEKGWVALSKLAEKDFPGDSAFVAEAAKIKLPLLKVDKNNYSIDDFMAFVKKEKPRAGALSTEYLADKYQSFVYAKLKEAKEKGLIFKNPEYRNLSNEYFDGILLFDVMNAEVWQKAEKDTAGIENFFAANKAKYQWTSPKQKGYVIHCKDESTLQKAKEIIAKNKGDKRLPHLLTSLNDSVMVLRVEVGTWGEGDNAYIDKLIYGKTNEKEMKGFPLFFAETKTINSPEDYTDVKGQIVSDYQDYLEKSWLETLRSKYKVEINKKVLETVK